MALPVFQRTVVNSSGDIIPSPVITVVIEATGVAASLFSDRNGTIALGSGGVFSGDANGKAVFYTAPGVYRVTAEDAGTGFSDTWRYVPMVGDAATTDTGTGANQIPTNNDLGPLITGGDYMTVGGTANAITLTSPSGYTLSSLSTGMQFRFRASTANTATATINIDGIGAVTCKTITGVDLPADYIRTDVDTVATYDGTNLVLDRQIEKETVASGTWYKHADGRASVRKRTEAGSLAFTADGNVFRTAQVTWEFPDIFVAGDKKCSVSDLSFSSSVQWVTCSITSTTTLQMFFFSGTGSAGFDVKYTAEVNGNWY